jgi:PKHD-type hydroxylase
MLLHIPSVLNSQELTVARQLLAQARFVDGRLSAGQAARQVKHNQEVDRAAFAELEPLNNLVMGKLVGHPLYRSGTLALRVAAPYYARYTPSMSYGNHVDDPIMGQDGQLYRSDASITVFLNEPSDYDGGELVVQGVFGEQRIKFAAGDAVLYPSSSLHRVEPVTRGERLVAVTWCAIRPGANCCTSSTPCASGSWPPKPTPRTRSSSTKPTSTSSACGAMCKQFSNQTTTAHD